MPRPLGGEEAMSGQLRLLAFVPQLEGQIQMAFEIPLQVWAEFQAQLVRELDIVENAEVTR